MNKEDKEQLVEITINEKTIKGDLTIPKESQGIVLFAHGAGSSRNSPRNNFVAEELQNKNLATLLIDLLTEKEKEIDRITREIRFDIDLLADRLIGTVDWLSNSEKTKSHNIGIFGSSTGAAGGLIAAAKRGEKVITVVSRGGRVDMASEFFSEVKVPVLCIVGGRDRQVLSLNRQAIDQMSTKAKLEIVEDAGHLFEEPGALEEVAKLSVNWYLHHLTH